MVTDRPDWALRAQRLLAEEEGVNASQRAAVVAEGERSRWRPGVIASSRRRRSRCVGVAGGRCGSLLVARQKEKKISLLARGLMVDGCDTLPPIGENSERLNVVGIGM